MDAIGSLVGCWCGAGVLNQKSIDAPAEVRAMKLRDDSHNALYFHNKLQLLKYFLTWLKLSFIINQIINMIRFKAGGGVRLKGTYL
jgi:hypothetical protein